MRIKTLNNLIRLFLFSNAFISCSDEVQELAIVQEQELKQIVMTTQDFVVDSNSRTTFNISEEAVNCVWAKNDTVGVFPDKGAQAYFPMISGAGTKNATFDGEGWALKDGRTYGAYYPCIGKFYLDKHAIPVSYTGQIQTGNNSVEHLGSYDYMVATPTAPEVGSAQFNFKHLSALVQLRIKVPKPTSFSSVKLVTDTKAFTIKGTVDITADTPYITSTDPTNEVVLNLQDVATTKENEVVTFYFMLPPADLSEQTLKAVLVTDKGNEEIVFEGKNFMAGTAYGLSDTLEEVIGNYKDGLVTLAKAGTMKKLLGDDYLNITSLKIIGPINGNDINTLNEMLDLKLAYLDLSDANIVEDGTSYTNNYVTVKTIKDVIGEDAFSKAAMLETVYLPKTLKKIETHAFYNCPLLKKVVMSDELEEIGSFTFAYCPSLEEFIMPNSVTEISGQDAFINCTSLRKVELSNKLTYLPYRTFEGCSNLSEIAFPENIVSFGGNLLSSCYKLEKVYIKSKGNVTFNMGFSYYCENLKEIHFASPVPPTFKTSEIVDVFGRILDKCTIYVPKGSLETYKNSKMGYFKSIVEE